MLTEQIDDADELIESIRAILVRTRVRGATDPAGDYQNLMTLIARARDDLDRHSWRARLLEGELLYSKNSREQAAEAVTEALSLNPRSAKAWALLAELQVDSFSFDSAEGMSEIGTRNARLLDSTADLGSLDIDLAVVRGRLKLNDPDGAEDMLRPYIERFPTNLRVRAIEAAIAARRFDYQWADDLLAGLDDLNPASADGYLAVGKTMGVARQYAEASKYLNLAAQREPLRAEPHSELGLLELQWGRDIPALESLERAAELDPFDRRADNSLTLIRELLTYETVESEHFTVRFRPGLDTILAGEMLVVLERLHDRVTGNEPGGIDHEPAEKTLIELMPDHAWFSVRITGMPKLFTIAAATGRVIAIEAPKEGPGHKAGPFDWERVIRHEYTHTVTLSRTRNRIPHWMTEAAAVYLEDSPRDFKRCKLLAHSLEQDELFSMSQIDLGFIRPRRPQDRQLAYAQGHWMYEFMIERFGERAPLELMDLYAEGVLQNEAFKRVLDRDPPQFHEEFLVWASAQVIDWGLKLPDNTPDIETLLLREAGGPPQAQADGEIARRDAMIERLRDPEAMFEIPGVEPEAPAVTAELLASWLEEYPRHPDVLGAMIRARIEGTRGRAASELVPLLERYAEARPVDPLPHRLLAQLYLGGLDSMVDGRDRAIPHLEFLDVREVNSPAYSIELARRYADTGDWHSAMTKAGRAVIISPYDADVRELAARIALMSGDLKSAEHQIMVLVEIEPDRDVHRRRLEALRKKIDAG